MRKNAESLAKASKNLMLTEPFYGLLLMSLNKVWSDKLPTAGVRLANKINYELAINPEFWESMTEKQKVGVLKHELLHIAFFHLTDYDHLSDREIRNIAMDIEINQYVGAENLPEGCCLYENFKDEYDLEEKKGSIYYYDKLMQKKKEEDPIIKAILNAIANGEPQCELPNGDVIDLPQHDWGNIENMNEAEKKLLSNQTKHIIKQVGDQVMKSKGMIPGEMSELLERISKVEPPKFDWKGYIRRFAGKSVKVYTKKSRRKYNKRLPDNPGLKIKRQKHILAAIDTSGSVSTTELKEFLNELYHMKKTGSEVTLIQCDTAISHVGIFDPKKDLEIHGRGGTDFQPVIDYYNEHFKHFSCLIYFTDGECGSPRNAKGNLLWVISSNGRAYEKFPGTTIQLEE